MKEFSIKILSPSGLIHKGTCSSLTFPTDDGLYGIMANHSPLVAALSEGVITVANGELKKEFPVKPGILVCKDNSVIVTTEGIK